MPTLTANATRLTPDYYLPRRTARAATGTSTRRQRLPRRHHAARRGGDWGGDGARGIVVVITERAVSAPRRGGMRPRRLRRRAGAPWVERRHHARCDRRCVEAASWRLRLLSAYSRALSWCVSSARRLRLCDTGSGGDCGEHQVSAAAALSAAPKRLASVAWRVHG